MGQTPIELGHCEFARKDKKNKGGWGFELANWRRKRRKIIMQINWRSGIRTHNLPSPYQN